MVLEFKYSSNVYVIIDSYHAKNISVLRQVIRDDWWGSDKNDVTYSKWIRRFLQGEQNTYHSLNYHVLIFRLNLLKVWNYDIPFQNRYLLNKEKKCFDVPYLLCWIIVFCFSHNSHASMLVNSGKRFRWCFLVTLFIKKSRKRNSLIYLHSMKCKKWV